MTDCLIIGFNDFDFSEHVGIVRSMDEGSGVFRDLKLAYVNVDGKPHRALDIFGKYYNEGADGLPLKFSNVDFLLPVITYLGTYLQRRGYSFDFVNLFQNEKDELRRKLESGSVLSVAITTTFYVSASPVLEIIAFIRKHGPNTKIIIGGPFISNQEKAMDSAAMQEFYKYLGADIYVISQEGELALVNILKELKSGATLDSVDNIAFAKGDAYQVTAASIESNSLEDNMPDYSLFPKARYGQFVSTRTAKSCPFSCAFCGFPQRAGKYKFIEVDEVEKEFDAIKRIGSVDTVTILDDTFNVPKKRFKEILRMMIRNNYGFKWNSFFRSDHGDEETIGLMKEAGCEGVFIGAESVSDVMLERMNKTSRKKDYVRAVSLLKQAGIITHVGFIIGFPGETLDTARETEDFINEAGSDFFRAQLWYCDPVTPIWQKRSEYKITGSAFNWAHATMTSKTASDIVERIFLNAENSIWMPQYGYELWSVFYLQRRLGMTLNEVKTFMRAFNNVIRQELRPGEGSAAARLLLENVRSAVKLESACAPEAEVGASRDDAGQMFNF